MERLYFILRLSLLLGRILYKMKVEGEENIPAEGGCVIAINHAAPMVDSLTGGVIFRRRPDAAFFGGAAIPRGGSLRKLLAPDEGEEGSVYLGAYKARGLAGGELFKALNMLRDGRAVGLAADGEITWDGRFPYPLRPGAAWMALRGQVPVVPVVSVGGYDIHPRWARFPKLTGRVTIRAGEPFYVSDEPVTRLTDEMLTAASDRIYNQMSTLMEH